MEILSLEKIEAECTSILMPCYCYKVLLYQKSDEHSLNYIERTALRLIENDSSFKNPQKLAKALGFPQKLEDLFYKVSEKIFDCNKINDAGESIPVLGYFFQDALSGALIDYVSLQEPRTQVGTTKGGALPKVSFKRDQVRQRWAYCLDMPTNKPNKPALRELTKALNTYNKNYPSESLSVESMEIKDKPTLLYLHCQLLVLFEGRFKLSDGFGGFSPILLASFEKHASEKLKMQITEGRKVEGAKVAQSIKSPFKFPTPYDDKIKTIEEKFAKHQSKQITDEVFKGVCGDLFDLCERVLNDTSQNTKRAIKEEQLKSHAEDMGFESFVEIPILGLKHLLQNKDERLTKIVQLHPHFLNTLKALYPFRNLFKHHSPRKRKELESIEVETIHRWQKEIYALVEVFLDNLQQGAEQDIQSDTNYRQNAILDARKEFDYLFDNLDHLDRELIVEIHFYLNYVDEKNHANQMKEVVICNLYQLFEGVFKQINASNKLEPQSKDALLISLRNRLGAPLRGVRESYLESAFAKGVASLGAHFLVFLSFGEARDDEIRLIERLIALRGHGNGVNIELGILSCAQLKALTESAFIYLKKLLKEEV
ncbi:hypothetical protein [Helicobacter felis]|uniref:hypothetical protein n=1 Tax=Helicobacter felis TaxID=214 RepID=UPI000CF163E4|nr:hypothetical protein [Helicobacter felis]